MLKFVLKVSCFFRKITSPILWFLIKPFLKKPDKNYWDEMKKLILTEFDVIMKDISYKSDPLWGILDYSYTDPNYYFFEGNKNNVLYGRDCDDIATTWYKFLKLKPSTKEIYMILCSNGWNLKQSHLFTVAKFDDGRFRLFNHTKYQKSFETLESVCDEFRTTKLLKSGKYEKLAWCVYKKHKKN